MVWAPASSSSLVHCLVAHRLILPPPPEQAASWPCAPGRLLCVVGGSAVSSGLSFLWGSPGPDPTFAAYWAHSPVMASLFSFLKDEVMQGLRRAALGLAEGRLGKPWSSPDAWGSRPELLATLLCRKQLPFIFTQ